MDAETINSLIKVLGHTYEKLLAEGLALGSSPTPLFPEGQNEDLIQKPAPGVELWFCAENRKLERTVITLSPIFNDDPVYEGELPKPFTRKMDQDGVRALMGEPYQSKGQESSYLHQSALRGGGMHIALTTLMQKWLFSI